MKGNLHENEEELDENLNKWFKEKWVRFGPDGKIRGDCARGDDSEGKPKCLPQKKAHSLGKKGRKYAASKKRREDPNPERKGKAKNVATKKKTNEGIPFNECPNCRGPIVHESMITEKQDACYHKVKSRYKVWPSAYASGALVQCRKKGASNWGTGGKKKNESSIMKGIVGETAYEKDLSDGEPRIVVGVYGAKSKEFRKKFANQKAQDNFFDHPDREGNYEINRVQKVDEAANPTHKKRVEEAKATQYVKPFYEKGGTEQKGWKASNGYHVKYFRPEAKAAAEKFAKINEPVNEDTDTYQIGQQLQDLAMEIKDLADTAMRLVRGTSEENRARSYWYPHIIMAISDDHGYMGKSMSTMMSSAESLMDNYDDDNYDDDDSDEQSDEKPTRY